ncbi:MAG: hypothetical protein COV46_04480 [Deltaproteobacteria bacterium CG11_big_fil_rev_8_21_14_0_20_49_13]|nr:MAG: hypothetical protein COV46_04480 [Deltaproteobacteria bacterium CG11_big_fil_rev_8_21_14_0_20_49_13]
MGDKRNVALVALLVLLVYPIQAFAGWDFSYRNLSQVKKGRFVGYEAPTNQYFSLGLSKLPVESSFQTDFKVFINDERDSYQFDLYQAVLYIEPVESLKIEGGRQWLSEAFDVALLDGLKLSVTPDSGYLNFSVYAGGNHYYEEGNVTQGEEGLLVGTAVNLQNVKDTSARFAARWRKADAVVSDWGWNDTIFLGLDASHRFSDAWATPNLYGNIEGDVAGKVVDTGTLGLQLYPHWRLALAFDGNYYNVSRSSAYETIFADYFTGRIMEGSANARVKIMKNLHIFEDLSCLRYTPRNLNPKNGYLFDLGVDNYFERAKLSTLAKFYYLKSYGGHVYGGYLALDARYREKWAGYLDFDLSNYKKITGQSDTATSLVGGVAYWFNKISKLSLGGELNHNQWFNRDARLTVDLEIGLTSSDYTPNKRSKRIDRRFHEI